ncbi:hypothetical protein MTR_6g049180 [Medicago truncatula]|uniref:Uncharacterized protein n=1 Tax=Medicago truncatula TaxID=3880 RepID=A0A072U9D8_MEDTR|nr:hypothetical protein MTR_6g049180 [Medicago truncatula]
MAQNHYQWTSERVITEGTPPPSKKEAGSVAKSPEQNSYTFGQQTTPPVYANNQRVSQKSSLEILLEKYAMEQSKQFQELKNQTEFLNDSLVKLTSKVESIATHTRMLETQISQVDATIPLGKIGYWVEKPSNRQANDSKRALRGRYLSKYDAKK